jgi:uroporphyrinogen decarboxylase
MDSRERVYCALHHVEPDRVPTDLWLSAGMALKLKAQLGLSADDLRDQYDIDLRYIDGPAYIGPPLRRFSDGDLQAAWSEDLWGVRRRLVTVPVRGGAETYQEVADSPLAGARSVEDVLAYERWPSADWFDYSTIAAQCRVVHAQGRVAVFQGDRLNRIAQLKPAMYLRGVEQILLDMSLQPEIARAIFSQIRAFYLAYAERILDSAHGELDLVLTGDDFGTQTGPMVSTQMWADLLGDGFGQYVALVKSHGIRVMHHTCGAVGPLIPLLVDRGLDVLQSLQPEASGMDPRMLKAAHGARLSFHGGISIQQTLPYGTEQEIRREVQERVRALAPGGGYILGTSHNIQADTPVQNVLALLEAYREYGRYR